jgi:hypothetical protein
VFLLPTIIFSAAMLMATANGYQAQLDPKVQQVQQVQLA